MATSETPVHRFNIALDSLVGGHGEIKARSRNAWVSLIPVPWQNLPEGEVGKVACQMLRFWLKLRIVDGGPIP